MSLMLGVSGIRGIVGLTLTPQVAAAAGCALATHVGGGRVVVGRDSRPTGDMVRQAAISGLLAGGCEVIDLGIVSTPAVGLMVRQLDAAGGMVITASHNPAQWNGIKFLTAQGSAPPADMAERLIDLVRSGSFALADYTRVGRLSSDSSTNQRHLDAVLGTVNVDSIRAKRFRVLLDSVNGAGGPAGRQLLNSLGCDVTHINAEPTGQFAHAPEPIAENLTDLSTQTAAANCQVGFAQDPDADRLAIVDERGTYIGEEYTLALAARQVFATRPGPAAANLSTSRMIDDLAAQAGGACCVHRSAVGEANVVEVMRRHNCVIGGEGNGGVIDPRVVYIRDSLASMALALELMATESRPLSAIVGDLPRYAMVKQKFECDRERIAGILDAVKREFASAQISTIDGVRIDWPEGWVHVRGSNTEPIMRIIAEAEDETTASELITRVRSVW